MINPQYSFKQASISFFVDRGLQMLIALVLMVLFEALGHVCDPRSLKPTILAFPGTPSLSQNGRFGDFAIIAKRVDSRDSISYRKGLECVFHTYLGSH